MQDVQRTGGLFCTPKTEYPARNTTFRKPIARNLTVLYNTGTVKNNTGGRNAKHDQADEELEVHRPRGKTTAVDLPHTWNNIDGQDGGNDYWRGTCIYKTRFAAPAFDKNTQQVWLQFEGVNASAKVMLKLISMLLMKE